VKRLVYFECFEDCGRAIAREKQIKSYARVKKLALIDSLNPEWHDLAEGWFASVKRADSSLRSE
jgi:putative endonuclease